mmetsp:Transcript_29904/g.42454  ORF Transcript_29904/g.42454 Transcript_29904/m.42454 type:complete len:296 (+) Transcript_29904:2-889(+)
MDGEHVLKGPISLFDFSKYDDIYDAALVSETSQNGGWRISDDSVIGGFSRSQFDVIRTKEDYEKFNMGDADVNSSFLDMPRQDDITNTAPASATSPPPLPPNDDIHRPFVRWHGTLDTRIGENSRADRSGFCAIRSPEFPFGGANLGHKYNALEFVCRSDGRPYTINLKVTTFFPDDMYQGLIQQKKEEDQEEKGNERLIIKQEQYQHPSSSQFQKDLGDGFSRVILPFRKFLHTSVGRVREMQRILDGCVQVETIGLTLMDAKDGDFHFDLARIRVVNYYDGLILGEEDEGAPY